MKFFLFFSLLFVQLYTSFLYASSEPTSLIVVRGTANCGKSTLCLTLNALWNNTYEIVSQDDLHRKVCHKALTTAFPMDMELISSLILYENRWQAIKYGNIIFPKEKEVGAQKKELVIESVKKIRSFFDDPDNNKQLKALNALGKQKTMHQLTLCAAQGKNVIFDAWGVTNWDSELNELQKYFGHLIGVVAYCSLQTVRLRWENRNSCAVKTENYTEMRLMTQMLKSFFGFLQPKTLEAAQACLTVTKTEFDELMEKALSYTQDRPSQHATLFCGREFTTQELLGFKNEMYAKFQFDEHEKVAIVPSVPYDILLCTEGDSCAYVADLLQKITLIQSFYVNEK